LNFNVIFFPECSTKVIKVQSEVDLGVKTLFVNIDKTIVPFTKAVVSNVSVPSQTPFDEAACPILNTHYTIEQVNYPGAGSFDPNLVTVEIDQEKTNDASKLTFHADRNSHVKSYNALG